MKRENYISWDTFFMGVAMLAAKRSKDPNTQVGACIVNKENRILSVGYNGAPNGYDDNYFPWNREGKITKYPYVCHAELNAILNFRGNMRELEDAAIYTLFFPCTDCCKAIIQSGIKRVYYLYDFVHSSKGVDEDAAFRMFNNCGISCHQIEMSGLFEILEEL